MRLVLVVLAALGVLASVAGGWTGARAQAAASVSYSIWNIDGAKVQMRFILPAPAASRLLAAAHPDPAKVSAAVGALLGVRSAAGDCVEPLVQDQWGRQMTMCWRWRTGPIASK